MDSQKIQKFFPGIHKKPQKERKGRDGTVKENDLRTWDMTQMEEHSTDRSNPTKRKKENDVRNINKSCFWIFFMSYNFLYFLKSASMSCILNAIKKTQKW